MKRPDSVTIKAVKKLIVLSSRFPKNIKLIFDAIPTEEYYRLIEESDVVLVPNFTTGC